MIINYILVIHKLCPKELFRIELNISGYLKQAFFLKNFSQIVVILQV